MDLGKDSTKNIFTLSVTDDGSVWASVPGRLYQLDKDGNVGNSFATTERDIFAFETKDGKTLTNVNLKGIIPEGNKLYYVIFKDNDGLSPKC